MGDSADCVADENCHILLTYRPSSDEGMVDFEMMYSGDGYVSVGFSSDQLMVSCFKRSML